MYTDVMTIQTDKPIATTVRLDPAHQALLSALQKDRPGTSVQRLFEQLLEESVTRREIDVASLVSKVVTRDQDALTALRDL
jgi:hypothetical protein